MKISHSRLTPPHEKAGASCTPINWCMQNTPACIMTERMTSGELLHCDEEVVLLATLNKEVLAVDEVVRGYFLIEGSEFLFVKAYTSTLGELTHFTL